MRRIEVMCCEGEPRRSGLSCLQNRCPEYSSAKTSIDWYPSVPPETSGLATDLSHLYKGETGHKVNLAEVRRRADARRRYDINGGTGNPI